MFNRTHETFDDGHLADFFFDFPYKSVFRFLRFANVSTRQEGVVRANLMGEQEVVSNANDSLEPDSETLSSWFPRSDVVPV